MRKIIVSILPIISFIVFALLYIVYDNEGYEYGFGNNFCNKKMPYNLKPIFYSQYPQRFYLLNEDDFELVGIGFRYETTNFEIKNLLAFGYNDTSVVVKCIDSLNNVRYLISYETSNKSKKGNPEISFKELRNSEVEKANNKYQWFKVDEEKGYLVDRNKFLSMLGALFSSIFFVWRIFKDRKVKAT